MKVRLTRGFAAELNPVKSTHTSRLEGGLTKRNINLTPRALQVEGPILYGWVARHLFWRMKMSFALAQRNRDNCVWFCNIVCLSQIKYHASEPDLTTLGILNLFRPNSHGASGIGRDARANYHLA